MIRRCRQRAALSTRRPGAGGAPERVPERLSPGPGPGLTARASLSEPDSEARTVTHRLPGWPGDSASESDSEAACSSDVAVRVGNHHATVIMMPVTVVIIMPLAVIRVMIRRAGAETCDQ